MIITLFGCGAIGSQLALFLAREDIIFRLIDDDRVTENNLATSAFLCPQVGANKSIALASLLYRKSKCTSLDYGENTLTDHNYLRFVLDANLAIDCFDNAEARRITCRHQIPTLHVGVSREGTGSITWDIHYIPFDGLPRGEDTFCTHLAGKGIIRLTATVAAQAVEHYIETSEKLSFIVTENFRIIKI